MFKANAVDRAMEARLAELAADNEDYWSFVEHPRSRGGRDAYIYPAMMVSPMQGALLELLIAHRSGTPLVADPFVGSGTTLEEAMRLGCSFVGVDINPMAILLSRVKSEPQFHEEAREAVPRVLARAHRDRRGILERGAWLEKWYRADVALALSRLRRAVRHEPNGAIRRPLWIALAEVARTSGNMRLSTPKLQTRPLAELDRPIDVAALFASAATIAVDEMARHAEALDERGLLLTTGYANEVRLVRADVRDAGWPFEHEADILITSPPYGDNHTTMPYGQHSFLPLCWIDVEDIDPDLDAELLATSQTLDTRSLGGSRKIDADGVARAADLSGLLRASLTRVAARRYDWARVASFFADLDEAIERAVAWCADDAHMVWTIGNRTVAGQTVPTTDIVAELLEARGVAEVTRLERRIPRSKRMAPRNERAKSTIATETVLVLRRLPA